MKPTARSSICAAEKRGIYFFTGMSAYAISEAGAQPIIDPFWHNRHERFMNPRAFREIEEAIYRGQQRAAAGSTRDFEVWQYSGETDLVSFMCYAREPDWPSLRSIRIEESGGEPSISLGRITEGLTRWAVDEVDEQFAPGAIGAGTRDRYASSLDKALIWAASAVAGGVLGNSAYDLIKLLGH